MSQLSPRETQEERVSSSSFSSDRPSPSFSAGLSFSSAFPVKVGESRSLFSTGSTCSCERLVLQRSPAKDVVKKEKKVTLNHPTHCQICAQRGIARIHAVCPLQDYKYASALRCGSI